MTLRTAVVVVVGVAAVSLPAGCGGGSGGSAGGPTATGSPDAASSLRAVATCMRAHGYPSFPDPIEDKDGNWNFPASADGVRTPPACDRLARRAKSQLAQSEPKRKPASASDIAKLRAFARCMRAHGLADWPDPEDNGAFAVPSRLGGPQGASLIRSREQACRQYLPSRGLVLLSPGSGSH